MLNESPIAQRKPWIVSFLESFHKPPLRIGYNLSGGFFYLKRLRNPATTGLLSLLLFWGGVKILPGDTVFRSKSANQTTISLFRFTPYLLRCCTGTHNYTLAHTGKRNFHYTEIFYVERTRCVCYNYIMENDAFLFSDEFDNFCIMGLQSYSSTALRTAIRRRRNTLPGTTRTTSSFAKCSCREFPSTNSRLTLGTAKTASERACSTWASPGNRPCLHGGRDHEGAPSGSVQTSSLILRRKARRPPPRPEVTSLFVDFARQIVYHSIYRITMRGFA